jgi:ribulose-phosphate 3-epimerase
VKKFAGAGSDVISFHLEAIPAGHEDVIGMIREEGCSAGLALNPDTPLGAAAHILADLDLLLIMSVFPGFGGQRFMPGALDKVREAERLRKLEGFGYVIEVDGGINADNAGSVREAGGRCLVAGTAVYRSGDYSAAIRAIRG